jgi:hypothetical protein
LLAGEPSCVGCVTANPMLSLARSLSVNALLAMAAASVDPETIAALKAEIASV